MSGCVPEPLSGGPCLCLHVVYRLLLDLWLFAVGEPELSCRKIPAVLMLTDCEEKHTVTHRHTHAVKQKHLTSLESSNG